MVLKHSKQVRLEITITEHTCESIYVDITSGNALKMDINVNSRLTKSSFYKNCFNQMMQYQESILWCYCDGDFANISDKYVLRGLEELDEAAETIVDNYVKYMYEEILFLLEGIKVQEICLKGFFEGHEQVIINRLGNRLDG
ncbi:MAG: hypothetical protein R3Y47_04615 [Lachnospiraceae bacterium]